MNFYVDVINKTIDYIEDNIKEKISLEYISQRFCISKFHFNRIFKTVSGMTLKQYILGRKLTETLRYLSKTDTPVIDIAYDFGFEYPEVFSRAFKKQFGVSPSIYRREKNNISLVEKANIVERDIVNYKGNLTLKETYRYIDKLCLEGVYIDVDVNNEGFENLMGHTWDSFLKNTEGIDHLNHEKVYTAVSCNGEDNGEYTVFYGMEREGMNEKTKFKKYIVPKGWYVSFIYTGDMFDIRGTFVDDLYKWIMIKEIQLDLNRIGMLNIYDKNYLENNEVQMLVAIEKD
ncbi:helix-turn-helix domain-containing protein [Dethiothermospora halolimnae]|uniref:helix-turn-helix domain-containing protein n=1 Tax=Dethiothermospora halolimnae TaxID=3114390 RepID=UPI003CCBEA59